MNVFACALKMETEARQYYERLATATRVPELKNLFAILGAAEEEHVAALTRLQESAEPAPARFAALDESACVFKPLLANRDLLAELENDPDAYGHVVAEEQESVRFYEELAAKATDERTRELLLMLAAEERKHLNIIENIYAFMEAPKTYLAWGEFSNLKEY